MPFPPACPTSLEPRSAACPSTPRGCSASSTPWSPRWRIFEPGSTSWPPAIQREKPGCGATPPRRSPPTADPPRPPRGSRNHRDPLQRPQEGEHDRPLPQVDPGLLRPQDGTALPPAKGGRRGDGQSPVQRPERPGGGQEEDRRVPAGREGLGGPGHSQG